MKKSKTVHTCTTLALVILLLPLVAVTPVFSV